MGGHEDRTTLLDEGPYSAREVLAALAIQTREGFVEQQPARRTEQSLRPEHALSLPSGKARDGCGCESAELCLSKRLFYLCIIGGDSLGEQLSRTQATSK